MQGTDRANGRQSIHKRMEIRLHDNTDQVWAEVRDLEIGDAFTLGEHCTLTFLVRDRFVGRSGKIEISTTVLVGLSNGRAYDKVMYRPALQVLLVPESKVGERLSAALDAFHARSWQGRERVELGPDVWPYPATEEAEVMA